MSVDLTEAIPHVIALCAIVSAITPNQYDNKAVNLVRKLVDLGALNFWHAKNAKKKK